MAPQFAPQNGSGPQFARPRPEKQIIIRRYEDKDSFAGRRRRRHSSGDRETWSRKVESLFAGLGYAVGLGNVWRFPYLCYRNGGGAFLIPYCIALVAVGFPMLFLEMSFGQFASLGPVTIWKVCPLFKGIGYAVLTVLLLVNTYYNVLIAYSLFFLFASITDELPWARCDNKWNTENCIIERCKPLSGSEMNDTDMPPRFCAHDNSTTEQRLLYKTPTEEFFEYHLLKKSSGIDELGDVQWPLIVCLGISWFVCFMCLFRGIKSMGKVVIVTTLFSYLVLFVLLVRGCTLPGAKEGIIYYLKPDFRKLANLQVWGEASAQVFASLSLGGGGWITLSSYNKFKNRTNIDAILVGVGNGLTSFLAGFVIFSVLGYMAHIKGVEVHDVTAKGPGLAFIAYPEGISLIPGAPFWSICFFFMMFTVGLDSLFGQVETFAAGIIDEYPALLRPNRKLFTLFICVVMFALGIPMITQGGIYIVTLMDWFTLLVSFSIISLFEIVVIVYIYGYRRFSNDIAMMIGVGPNWYYKITWIAVSPITLLCVIIFLFVNYAPPELGEYVFPDAAISVGWAFALCPCALIPITMIVMFFYKAGSCEVLRKLPSDSEARSVLYKRLILPAEDWGPALPSIFRKYSANLGQGLNKEAGDDDVFGGGCELKSYKTNPEDRAVKFSDEAHPTAPKNEAGVPEVKVDLAEDEESGLLRGYKTNPEDRAVKFSDEAHPTAPKNEAGVPEVKVDLAEDEESGLLRDKNQSDV